MNLDNLSIRNKIILGISIALALMVIVSVTVFINVVGLQETSRWVEHTQEVMAKGNQLTAEMVNMETGMRGFLVAGKDEFLEPYEKGQKRFAKIMAETQQLVNDNPAQVTRLEKIDELASQWLKKAAQVQIDLRRRVNIGIETVKHFDEIRGRVVGKKIFDNMRKALDRIDDDFKRENNQVGRYLVQSILLDLVDMETGQRGFLLTGRDASLDPYKNGQLSLERNLDDMNSFIKTSQTNVTGNDLDELKKLEEAWIEQAAKPEIEARYEVNKVPATMADLVAFIDKKEGKKYMDEIRVRINEVIDIEENLMITRQLDAEETALMTEYVIVLGTFLAIIFGFLAAFIIARRIANPMADLVTILNSMAKGNVDQVATVKGTDEVSKLGTSFNTMINNLKTQVDLTSMIAQGDLTKEVRLASAEDALGQALRKMTDNLNNVLHQVTSAADQVSIGSRQLADSSQNLSQGATEQSASLEQISSSMEEMSSQTKANAENAGQANQLAGAARQAAEEGNDQMKLMLESMKAINESSESISNIIKTIDEIAFQTNVLAINAAVEAARAGVHGKGFAVVAEEVRNLAQRSAAAAKETTVMINDSVKKAEAGAKIADKTATSLREIVSGVTKVTDLVNEINSASNEQARGVNEINKGLSQLNQVTQKNAQVSQESSSASEELTGQAENLKQMVMRFKLRQQEAYGLQSSLAMSSQTTQIPTLSSQTTKLPALTSPNTEFAIEETRSKKARKGSNEEELISFDEENVKDF